MSSRFQPNQYPLEAGVRLLEASAGTGKTFALAHLVLRLVTERKLNLKELLVVTFTEAAAAELRERIGRRLNDALQALLQSQTNNSDSQTDSPPTDAVMEEWLTLHGQDPNTRRTIASNLLEALEGLERADITTIHGFCRRSLRRQALQNGTAIEVCLENDSQHLCQEVAYDYWEQQVLALPPDDVSGLLHAGLSADQLSHALSRLDSDCAVRIAGTEGSDDLERPLIDCFNQWLQSSWTEFEAEWNVSGHTLETALRDCSTDWRSQGQTDTKPYSPKPKKDRANELSSW
ncbi:UvrD-helicase domain-containing protein, partial [Synechococcus sp. MU1655]|uniref:UvrD-helicase domain-containing protein n=1 Tax=Synechococcus sp. MU1655 TaxID=2508355 RepID=UPI002026D0C8